MALSFLISLTDVNLYLWSPCLVFLVKIERVGDTKRSFIFCLCTCIAKPYNSSVTPQLLKIPSLNTVDLHCSATGKDFTTYQLNFS